MKRSEGRRRKRADRLLLKQRLRRERSDPFAGPAATKTSFEKGNHRGAELASRFGAGVSVDPEEAVPEPPRSIRHSG